MCRDLDQASMEAVAALLAGLPLQPEESDRGDLMEAKSQLFLKSVAAHYDCRQKRNRKLVGLLRKRICNKTSQSVIMCQILLWL